MIPLDLKRINKKNGIMPVSHVIWETIDQKGRVIKIFLTIQFFEAKGIIHLFNLSIDRWNKYHNENLEDIILIYNSLIE